MKIIVKFNLINNIISKNMKILYLSIIHISLMILYSGCSLRKYCSCWSFLSWLITSKSLPPTTSYLLSSITFLLSHSMFQLFFPWHPYDLQNDSSRWLMTSLRGSTISQKYFNYFICLIFHFFRHKMTKTYFTLYIFKFRTVRSLKLNKYWS